jgi:hypothetical protein
MNSSPNNCGHTKLYALDMFNQPKRWDGACLLCERDQLRAALVHAVEVIQTWHNTGIPRREHSDMWDIYWRNAPEMKAIREALKSQS